MRGMQKIKWLIMDPMEPWWNQIHRWTNNTRGFASSRVDKDKVEYIGGIPMNSRKEMQGWEKVENIYLRQELAEAKREAKILM